MEGEEQRPSLTGWKRGGGKGNDGRPDSEVGAMGVVAPHRGHPAGVRPDVARPRLGDVQGPVGIQPQARGGVDVDGAAALLPHVPDGRFEKAQGVSAASVRSC